VTSPRIVGSNGWPSVDVCKIQIHPVCVASTDIVSMHRSHCSMGTRIQHEQQVSLARHRGQVQPPRPPRHYQAIVVRRALQASRWAVPNSLPVPARKYTEHARARTRPRGRASPSMRTMMASRCCCTTPRAGSWSSTRTQARPRHRRRHPLS
jgi:hypothetical protein